MLDPYYLIWFKLLSRSASEGTSLILWAPAKSYNHHCPYPPVSKQLTLRDWLKSFSWDIVKKINNQIHCSLYPAQGDNMERLFLSWIWENLKRFCTGTCGNWGNISSSFINVLNILKFPPGEGSDVDRGEERGKVYVCVCVLSSTGYRAQKFIHTKSSINICRK